LMKSEREIYKNEVSDYSNGFRNRKAFGDKRMLELQIPRTRNGGFYPVILALLKNQEQEARTPDLASHLHHRHPFPINFLNGCCNIYKLKIDKPLIEFLF